MIIDKDFRPLIVEIDNYNNMVRLNPNHKLTICVERNNGYNYIYSYNIFNDGINDELNNLIAERIIKSILWICGGYKIYIDGSIKIYEYIKDAYSKNGIRKFDKEFMERVYEKEFEVIYSNIPAKKYASIKAFGNLNGNRIGFDAGGSDMKVSAVIDGKSIYSEEIVWNPKLESNPEYHYRNIKNAIIKAKDKLGRVDSIGVSSAGVYIDNKIMVASLFVKCDYSDYIKNMYINIAKEIGAPIKVANDGDVTALAGALSLNDNSILGIAMGTSEAGGYINKDGNLNDWLSELAFVPIDLNENALVDEWSKDIGVGCKYFSQDAVIKLANIYGFTFNDNLTLAEKLKVIQNMEGSKIHHDIFNDIGEYLAYALAYYQLFYDIKHVLILGRVTSGKGGEIILNRCMEVINESIPSLKSVNIALPDEKNRRVGQSIAAASLVEE